MSNRMRCVLAGVLLTVAAFVVRFQASGEQQLREEAPPATEGVSTDGWKARVTSLHYESSVDLTKQERKTGLGVRFRLTPPEGTPLAAPVLCGIVQALDGKGVNIIPPSREFTHERALKRAQDLSQGGVLWSPTPHGNTIASGLAELPATLRKVRVRCYLLVPGEVKVTEISPVAPTESLEFGPGLTGKIVEVRQPDSIQPHIYYNYRLVVAEEWKELPVWPTQMCRVEGVEDDGRVVAAGVPLSGRNASRAGDEWEYSGYIAVSRGKLSPRTPTPGKPLRSLRVHVATEARLQTVEVEFDRITLTAWPGLLPQMSTESKPAEIIMAAANDGWKLQIVGAAYRSSTGTGILAGRHETELHFAIFPPEENTPLKLIAGGLAAVKAGGEPVLPGRPFEFVEHELSDHVQDGYTRPWDSHCTFHGKLVTRSPIAVLTNVVARATVLMADDVQTRTLDVPQGLQTVRVTDEITGQFRGGARSVPEMNVALHFRSSIGSRPGKSGPLPDYLSPQVCGVVPLGEADKPLAVHSATFDHMVIVREGGGFWAGLSVIVPPDGGRPSVIKKLKVMTTDRPRYQDIEGTFQTIDLRAIPGLFPGTR